MGAVLKENEVAFFRHRNRLLAGVCLSVGRGKARFATPAQGTVNVPVENVLLATGAVGGDREAAAWWEQAAARSAEMDLEEVWDLVRDEGESWGVEELGDFYFEDGVRPDRLAALLVHLEACPYFEANGETYRPMTEAEVAEAQEAEARAQARAKEQALFQRWFLEGEEIEDLSLYLASWVDRLKDCALYGENSAHARWVERMSGRQADRRRAFDRMVELEVWDENEHLDLIREDVPVDFPEVVLRAAGRVELDPLLEDGRRQDLTGLSVFTIDDALTTDMDDGVSVVLREDGTCQVGVHITDVAALIPAGSKLDREAAGRVSSLYFPECKIPMFPPEISEALGSLCPDAPRLALSLCFDVAADGSVGGAEIAPSVICCREKLTYDRADAILDDPSHPLHASLSALHRVAEAHWVERMHAGAVALEHAERQIRVTPEGEIQVSMRHRDSRSNMLVSELMVMANVAVAQFCRDRQIPIVYRTQQGPDLSDLQDAASEIVQRYRILRRMPPATMGLEPGTHGGLGVEPYCQASSPLRRYVDLAVQRQVVAFLLGEPLPYDAEGMQEVLFQAGERVREINRLERRRERYWLFKYLEDFVGQDFEAVVLETWERGFYAEVPEYGFRAEVKPSRPVEPEEALTLRLSRCDPWEDRVSFTHLE